MVDQGCFTAQVNVNMADALGVRALTPPCDLLLARSRIAGPSSVCDSIAQSNENTPPKPINPTPGMTRKTGCPTQLALQDKASSLPPFLSCKRRVGSRMAPFCFPNRNHDVHLAVGLFETSSSTYLLVKLYDANVLRSREDLFHKTVAVGSVRASFQRIGDRLRKARPPAARSLPLAKGACRVVWTRVGMV